MDTYSSAECAKKLKTDLKSGLSQNEAKKRLRKFGKNQLKEKRKKGIVFLFFEQFNDFLIIVLMAAACISFFTNIYEHSGDIAEPLIILAIVILNAVLGVVQERKAEKSLDALKKMTAPESYVIRDGKEVCIPAADVVPGDVVIIRAGDIISADLRLAESVSLEVDESALTGESVPVYKDASCETEENLPLAERADMAYSGTYVTGGYGKGIAVATGMNTEVGTIASMLTDEQSEPTPLQKKLDYVGKCLGICALLICALVFVIGVCHHLAPFDMFVTSVSLAVAAIPEGLPAIVTIMLSIGVQKMAQSGAIVRNLTAVEALGGADVICSDKTGTLTQNKMTVTDVFGDELSVVKYGMLCSASNTKNPTELAIADYAGKINYKTDNKLKKTSEIPFSSSSKQMRIMYGELLTVKGAPEIILPMCDFYSDNGKVRAMTDEKRRMIESRNKKYASEALRVIAVAYKNRAKSVTENKLVFCGLAAMSDPPRKDAAIAVKQCGLAGIKPVMITGDHAVTACSVAKEMGILSDEGKYLTGSQLDKMTDEELCESVEDYSVFARTTPSHKLRIVKAFKKKKLTVAMTGDGVNDAPALKCADIGCGLGKSGTEVAKASSDIVLTDDNFAGIIKAVRIGREIYANIKKSVKFLLSSNIGEIFAVFAAIILGLPSPLGAMQLLWINLVTDSLPAIALGVDPPECDLLTKGKNTMHLFSTSMTVAIVTEGLLIGSLGLAAFCIGMFIYGSTTVGRTMCFCVLSLCQLVHAFNMRSDEESIFKTGILKNKLLVVSFLAGCAMQLGVVYFVPEFFGVMCPTGEQWGIIAIMSVVPLAAVEIQKAVNRLFRRNCAED